MADLYDLIGREEVERALDTDPDVQKGKLELAQEAAAYARSIAPVDQGDYRDGIVATVINGEPGVDFTDPISGIIEYGSEDTPEFAVRARTVAHFGGQPE